MLASVLARSTGVVFGKIGWLKNKAGFFINSGAEPVNRKVTSVFCCGLQSLHGL